MADAEVRKHVYKQLMSLSYEFMFDLASTIERGGQPNAVTELHREFAWWLREAAEVVRAIGLANLEEVPQEAAVETLQAFFAKQKNGGENGVHD